MTFFADTSVFSLVPPAEMLVLGFSLDERFAAGDAVFRGW
jgi:hypothetical protein